MPHYADGTEAKVGDQVIAPCFNSGGPKAGTIVSITPGVESCNAMIQFTVATEYGGPDPVPRMALKENGELAKPRDVQGEAHGSKGPIFQLWTCVDYCDTNKLTKVS